MSTESVFNTRRVGLQLVGGLGSEESSLLNGDETTRAWSPSMRTSSSQIAIGGTTRFACPQPGEYRLVLYPKDKGVLGRRVEPASLPQALHEARVLVEPVDGPQTFRFEWP